MANNADLRTVLAYEAIKGEFESEIAALKKENAELRRWLGAAAECIDKWGHYPSLYVQRDTDTFRALSRGEPVSDDVRRLYLGDEE